MEEMCRLTNELEQVHMEERKKALEKLKGENLHELQKLLAEQKMIEQQLVEEVSKKNPAVTLANSKQTLFCRLKPVKPKSSRSSRI